MSGDKSDNFSNSPSACGEVFTTIFCCRCQKDSDFPDHKNEHMPDHTHYRTAKAGDAQTESQRAEVVKNKPELPSKEAAEKGGHGQTHAETRGKKTGLAKNDTFSEYINRAKAKIRTMSSLGSRKTASEADADHDTKKDNSGQDVFSDYINRAKMKIRKASTPGSRKCDSLE